MMRERNNMTTKNQKEGLLEKQKKTKPERINRNRSEKIRTISKSTSWSKPVVLTRYVTFLQITCRAMFSVFAVGTLWAKKI